MIPLLAKKDMPVKPSPTDETLGLHETHGQHKAL